MPPASPLVQKSNELKVHISACAGELPKHREEEQRGIGRAVHRRSERHLLAWQAADVGVVATRAAEMADQLDATGRHASLDPEAVADLAANVGCTRERQHLAHRLGAPEEAACEERVEEANEVTSGCDQGVSAGSAGHRRIETTDVEHFAA